MLQIETDRLEKMDWESSTSCPGCFKSVRSTVIRSSCFPLLFFFFPSFFSQQRGLKIEFINSLWWCFAPSVKLILLFMFLCFLPLYNWEVLCLGLLIGLFRFCD